MPKGTEPSARRGTVAPACSSQSAKRSLIRWRTVAGESGPIAFFSGSNSTGPIGLDDRPALGQRQGVEDELLELHGVRLGGLDRSRPPSSTYGTFLIARWNGSSSSPTSRSMNVALEDVDGDAPGPELQAAPRARGGSASSGGRSEYSITWGRPSTRDDHAQLLVGRRASRSTLNDISASAWRCRPMKAGSAIWTSGLSTWK